jgi:hypothetical protein
MSSFASVPILLTLQASESFILIATAVGSGRFAVAPLTLQTDAIQATAPLFANDVALHTPTTLGFAPSESIFLPLLLLRSPTEKTTTGTRTPPPLDSGNN